MTVIHECYSGTNYSEDRLVFAQDIAMAMGWIVELKKGIVPEDVIAEILSSSTEKYFGDYWRQGDWGDMEINALQKLKQSI